MAALGKANWAVGDYDDEAAVLLLIYFGHLLPQRHSAGLIAGA